MEIIANYTHPILVLQFWFSSKCFHFFFSPSLWSNMPDMQMFDPMNIQKLIVFSGLAKHKATCVCRKSIFQKQQVNIHRHVLCFAKGTCQSLVSVSRKEKYSWSIKSLQPLPPEVSRKDPLFKQLPLIMQHVLSNNNLFPRVNICLFPRTFSGPLANFNPIW